MVTLVLIYDSLIWFYFAIKSLSSYLWVYPLFSRDLTQDETLQANGPT